MDNLEKSYYYLKRSEEYKKNNEKEYFLAEIYTKYGKYDEAIKIYLNLSNKNPDNIEYIIALTNSYILNRDFFNARKVLKKFIKNNPKDKNNKRFEAYGILKIGL